MPRGQATKPRANWNFEAESILLSALKDVLKDGAASENNFKPQVYSQISAQLLQAGYAIDSDQVKSRWTRVCTSPAPLLLRPWFLRTADSQFPRVVHVGDSCTIGWPRPLTDVLTDTMRPLTDVLTDTMTRIAYEYADWYDYWYMTRTAY